MIILRVLLILIMMSTSGYAFDWNDLNDNNIADRIVKSIQTEPDKWMLRNSGIYYFEREELKERAERGLFPEVLDGCLIDVSISIFYKDSKNNGYVIIEKPFKLHPEKDDRLLLIKAIEQYIFEYLYKKGHRISEPKEIEIKPSIKTPIKTPDIKPNNIDDRYGSTDSRY